jgi:biotin operon repressor
MRLTTFTDYGLRMLMRLAGAQDRLFTTDEIATELQISRNHLTKVVRDLSGAGYVRTQRGAGGGLRLQKPPQSVSRGRSSAPRHRGMFPDRRGTMHANSAVPPQVQARGGSRSLPQGTRRNDARGMRLSGTIARFFLARR